MGTSEDLDGWMSKMKSALTRLALHLGCSEKLKDDQILFSSLSLSMLLVCLHHSLEVFD